MSKILITFRRLFCFREKYLFIGIFSDYAEIAFLGVDLENKKIKVNKVFSVNFNSFDALKVLHEVRLFLKKVRNLGDYNFIFSLDSRLATTLDSTASVMRRNFSEPITEADMDNLASEAVLRVFDRQRAKIAKKMGIADVDVSLFSARVEEIKIDGHKVINPIGFKAKSIEFHLEHIYVSRDFICDIIKLLPADKVSFLGEAGTILSRFIAGRAKADNSFLVDVFFSRTDIFSASDGKVFFMDSLDWGKNNIIAVLKNKLSLDSEMAEGVLSAYLNDKGSKDFLRRIENIVLEEVEFLVRGLELVIGDSSAKIYINSFFGIPPVIFSQRFKDRFKKDFKLILLSTDFIGGEFDFELRFNKSAGIKNIPIFSAFMKEGCFSPKEDALNRIIKRRVRWLAASQVFK